MPLFPLTLPPGVFRNGTEYQAKGRWYDANFIRWQNGRLQPIGGWQRVTPDPMDAPARGMLTWRADNGARYLGTGTAKSLYIHDGGALKNITPAGITEGRVDSLYGLGWGIGMYGAEAYGIARSGGGSVLEACSWSLDNWGSYLVACSNADGTMYYYDPDGSTGQTAVAIPGAPVDNRALVVTSERFLVALAADGNPRRVAWSDQQDFTTWAASATNQAGDLDLQTSGLIQAAKRFRTEVLIFTDVDVHAMRYVGAPYVYGIERVADSCGLLGPNAAVNLQSMMVWMSESGFYIYDGYARPLPSEVHDYVYQDINILQGAKVAAAHNSEFGEVWWFYPSANSLENDRYVIWNYRENWWSVGNLDRTAWADRGAWNYPVGAGSDGHLYQHEQGYTDNGQPRFANVYAKSGAVEIGNGDQVLVAKQLLQDGSEGGANFTLEIAAKSAPEAPAYVSGPYTLSSTGYTDVRFTGRQIQMTVRGKEDDLWHLGNMRLDAVNGGRR